MHQKLHRKRCVSFLVEFQHILKIIQAKFVFCDKEILPQIRDALEKLKLEPKVIVVHFDSVEVSWMT